MGEQSITNSPLFGWLRLWSSISNATEEAKPVFEALARSPSEAVLKSFFRLMNGLGSGASLFEEYATDLWVMHRAENLGIWREFDAAPQVYFDGPMMMAPAPVDNTTEVFRGTVSGAIGQLFEHEKIVIVFSRSIPETRSFVAPELFRILRSEGRAPKYFRMYSRTTPSTENTPELFRTSEKNIILDHRGLNEASKILKTASRKPVVLLDFLEFADWLYERPKDWLSSYKGLIDNLNSNVIEKKEGRIVIVLQSDPFSYIAMWKRLLPFIQALAIEQPSFLFVGILPQLANAIQAANFLQINLSDAKLMASRIPLLASALVKMRLAVEQSSSKERNFDLLAATMAMKLPPGRSIIESDYRFVVPDESGRRRIPLALHPTLGHEIFALTTDGETLNGEGRNGAVPPPVGFGPQIDGFDPELISGAPFLYGPNIMNGASMMIAPVVTMPPMMTLLSLPALR